MFAPEQRDRLRFDLLEYAAGDRRISGAAMTGSAAAGREDRWSDIDLAFGVGDATDLPNVLSDWTAHMYRRHLALHHLDITSGAWVYRVFCRALCRWTSPSCQRRSSEPWRRRSNSCLESRMRRGMFRHLRLAISFRPCLAVCAACADLHCQTTVVASGIHD